MVSKRTCRYCISVVIVMEHTCTSQESLSTATSVNSFFVNVAKKSSKDVTCDNSSQIHISSSLCDGPEVDEETVSQEDTSTFQVN